MAVRGARRRWGAAVAGGLAIVAVMGWTALLSPGSNDVRLERTSWVAAIIGALVVVAGLVRWVWLWQSVHSAQEQHGSEPAPLAGSYLLQVQASAPAALLDREEELAAIAAFCAGESSYCWWQGPPWAGKSALMAWFALHPPAYLHVVSFFVNSQLPDEADSGAFITAVVSQLAVLLDQPATRAHREPGQLLSMLSAAADRLPNGQRLLLIVDGLDEDVALLHRAEWRRSIATLLPARPPERVRVLVTSRRYPGVQDEKPGVLDGVRLDHPLRDCQRWQLPPSPHAHDLEIAAHREVRERLRGSVEGRDLISLLAAATVGLTVTDLAELTGLARFEVEDLLAAGFGRCMETRQFPSGDRHVVAFSHQTLQRAAEEVLDGEIVTYRDRIHAWADGYKTRGWPIDTPAYLLQPYGQLLEKVRDTHRLAKIATDGVRHDRMSTDNALNPAPLDEIAAARSLLASQEDPDVAALAVLPVERDRIASRNHAVPVNLPATWVRLGQPERGRAIARCIPNAAERERAHELFDQAREGVAPDWADVLFSRQDRLRSIDQPRTRDAEILAEIAACMSDPRQAAGLAEDAVHKATITEPVHQAVMLSCVAGALAPVDPDRASRLAAVAEDTCHLINKPGDLAEAFAYLAEALAATASDHAARLATAAADQALADKTIRAPAEGTEANLERVAWALATAHPKWNIGLGMEAQLMQFLAAGLANARLLDEAEHTATAIPAHSVFPFQDVALAEVAGALAAAGRWDQAERVVMAAHRYRGYGLAIMAEAARDDPTWAAELTDRADRASRDINGFWRPIALAKTARALVTTDPHCAIRLAEDAKREMDAMEPKVDLPLPQADRAGVLALSGRFEDAIEITKMIRETTPRARALADIVSSLAEMGQASLAEKIARRHITPPGLAVPLAAIAAALSDSDPYKARDLADEAEKASLRVPHPHLHGELRPTPLHSALPGVMGPGGESSDVGLLTLTAGRLLSARPGRHHPVHRTLHVAGRRLIARVLTHPDRWYVALPVLGKTHPEAVTNIYTRLTHLW